MSCYFEAVSGNIARNCEPCVRSCAVSVPVRVICFGVRSSINCVHFAFCGGARRRFNLAIRSIAAPPDAKCCKSAGADLPHTDIPRREGERHDSFTFDCFFVYVLEFSSCSLKVFVAVGTCAQVTPYRKLAKNWRAPGLTDVDVCVCDFSRTVSFIMA